MSYRREEWIASLIAAFGSMWFVAAITSEFPRFIQYVPPTGGPTEVIGLAVLLWLHAKHLRFLEKKRSALQSSHISGTAYPPSMLLVSP